jgi:rhodanese-related sulfurtransferase
MVESMKKYAKNRHCVVYLAIFFVMSFVFLFFLSCSPAKLSGADEISELITSGNENLIIIDLRDLNAFSKGHIAGAINIPYREDTFPARIASVSDKNKILIIYCGQGVKTGKAEKFIKKSSFKKKYILEGGFKVWKEKGFQVEQ